MCQTFTAPKTARKPGRAVRVLCPTNGAGQTGISIRDARGVTKCYWVEERGCELGRAFTVTEDRDGAETYNVLLANVQDTSCDCAGGCYRGQCKHTLALLALAGRDLI